MKTSLTAHAKLNLFLEVTGKRRDGYHELHSLVAFLDFGDGISIEPSDKLEIAGAEIEDNIVLKAAHKLDGGMGRGVKITLTKNIPLGGGLGGGSADAAAVIVLLNNYWNLQLPHARLYEIALSLGADVPVCLYSILENKNTAVFKGIGEIIEPAPALSPMYFVLVHPGKGLTTAEVFRFFRYEGQVFKTLLLAEDLAKRRNDLQDVAVKLMPEIGTILTEIARQPGCTLSRMTGSGATCFGLFASAAAAHKAAADISARQPGWFVKAARLKD